MTMTTTTVTINRGHHQRTVAIANGKGGVGKTTTSVHLGGIAATAGYRVLLVDLDPQGNCGDDLGYNARGETDNGRGLAAALQFGHDPYILQARPNLDVIPGGEHLDDAVAALTTRLARAGRHTPKELPLLRMLDPLAAQYSLILLDCPPRMPIVQEWAMEAARYLLIPTKTDVASLRGMEEMSVRFGAVQAVNPGLTLLGVLLFGVMYGARRARQEARRYAEACLGDQAPVLNSIVRHVETAACDIRRRGQLAHELEGVVLSSTTSSGRPTKAVQTEVAASACGLAEDLHQVTGEVLERIVELETARAAAVAA